MTIPTEVAQLKIETDGTDDPIDLTSEFGALYYLNPADVRVAYRDPDGVETLWFIGDDYTLDGNGAEGEGTLTPIAETEAGGHICVWRETPLVQDLNLEENDGFPAQALERAEDRQIIIDQDTRRMVLASIHGCVCDPPMAALPCAEDRAGKCLHFDEDGQPVVIDCDEGRIIQYTVEMETVAGEALPAGFKRKGYIGFACSPAGWVIQAYPVDGETEGSIAFDVRMKTFGNDAPPSAGDSIVAAAPPELITGTDIKSAAVETWTMQEIAANTAVEIAITSCVNIKSVTLNLLLNRGASEA